jgi:hypothetical protein
MQNSKFVHVGQRRDHCSQDVPHPCNFKGRLFQELPDVCFETLKDQAYQMLIQLAR